MTTYLITGVAGFIGSHLARALLARGDRVRGIDDFSTGQRQNLADLPSLDLIEGSITDIAVLEQAMQGVDYVLHHAAVASVPLCLAEPARSEAVNAGGTLKVLHAAAHGGVKRVVFASSSAVYGNAHVPPLLEGMPADPLSPYAAHKLAAEHYVQHVQRAGQLDCVTFRYFNVYGPCQNISTGYAAVIPKFIDRALRGESPVIFGDGRQSRDFTYVADVVRANLLACAVGPARGGVFNIACGVSCSLLTLVAHLGTVLGRQLTPHFEPPLAGEVRHSQAQVAAARHTLDFAATTTLLNGLAQTVRWYQAKRQ